MNNIEIGKRIHNARTLRKYTLDEVAKKIGVAKSTIQRYENGKITKIKLPVIDSIANALAVNPAWLVGKSEEMEIHTTINSSSKILQYYNKLNDFGKKEATKRVEELTYIPMYNNEQDTNLLNAAHSLNNATSEEKANDEDIMNDENF